MFWSLSMHSCARMISNIKSVVSCISLGEKKCHHVSTAQSCWSSPAHLGKSLCLASSSLSHSTIESDWIQLGFVFYMLSRVVHRLGLLQTWSWDCDRLPEQMHFDLVLFHGVIGYNRQVEEGIHCRGCILSKVFCSQIAMHSAIPHRPCYAPLHPWCPATWWQPVRLEHCRIWGWGIREDSKWAPTWGPGYQLTYIFPWCILYTNDQMESTEATSTSSEVVLMLESVAL